MNISDKILFTSTLKEYPDVMNIDEMCQALGISTKTGYRLLREGRIEHLKVGRTYRIPKIHLLSYLKICRSE